MKHKEARDRLFRHSKPNIRPIAIVSEDGNYSKDMGVLWAAYLKGSFSDMGELSQGGFTDKVLEYLSNFHFAWIVEDSNYKYPSGYGATGLIVAHYDGWTLSPRWMPFSWATARNKLRMAVSFFQMAKYEKGVGVLNVNTNESNAEFFHRLKKNYGVVYFVGKFPRGDFGDDKYIFYARGKDFFKGRRLVAA